eukprot:366546-Chlamydomonas_euryale.AAC.30
MRRMCRWLRRRETCSTAARRHRGVAKRRRPCREACRRSRCPQPAAQRWQRRPQRAHNTPNGRQRGEQRQQLLQQRLTPHPGMQRVADAAIAVAARWCMACCC